MTIKSLILNAMLTIALSSSITTLAAEDTSMHAVYSAAEAGKFGEAQAMMDKVLQDHPNSAKAHYVEAELLAKQGKMSQAQTELATAEKLQPGLPFAKPAAVEKLKSRIGVSESSSFSSPTSNTGTPWSMILIIAGLVAFMYFAVKMMNRRNQSQAPMGSYGSNGPTNPQPYGAAPMMNPAPSGGLGSGIMGGLATGAALGAGMVAGEALMHHFTDSGNNNGLINDAHAANNGTQDNNYLAQDDMGGNDFGIADNSSWDDSAIGSDDWT
jgi:hypothetical protein